MKITLNIDEKLLAKAKGLTGIESDKEIIEKALKLLIEKTEKLSTSEIQKFLRVTE